MENGQTLRDVEAPGSWQGGAAFAPDAQTLEALRAWVSVADEDGDGQVSLPAEVNLFEDGVVIGQRPDLQLALDGDQVQLALGLGITRRGYEVLRAIELDATGDATVDAWLAAASDAFVEAMPPFRSGRRAGLLLGDGIGACATALISASPAPDASPGARTPRQRWRRPPRPRHPSRLSRWPAVGSTSSRAACSAARPTRCCASSGAPRSPVGACCWCARPSTSRTADGSVESRSGVAYKALTVRTAARSRPS